MSGLFSLASLDVERVPVSGHLPRSCAHARAVLPTRRSRRWTDACHGLRLGARLSDCQGFPKRTVKVSRRDRLVCCDVAQGSRSLLASSVPCLTGPMERSSTGYFEVHWIGGRSEMWSFRLNREDGKTVMASYSYG